LFYANNEIEVKCNWKKKLLNSKYYSKSELVITQKRNIDKGSISRDEIYKGHGIFIEDTKHYYDESFWNDFIIISPEENLEKAAKKLAKKIS